MTEPFFPLYFPEDTYAEYFAAFSPALDVVNAAIAMVVEKQRDGAPQARSDYGLLYEEHSILIELPDNALKQLTLARIMLGNALAAVALDWLKQAAGYRDYSDENKIPEVVWRIRPEFDVQHTQVPASEGYEGETFKDFLGGTDQPFCWGPWVAKLYMRFHVVTNVIGMREYGGLGNCSA